MRTRMRGTGAVVLGLGLALGGNAPACAAETAPKAEARSSIDLVICLDTSGSMDGLIGSAKMRLWDIVNELAKVRPAPRLRVALYSYGNNGIPAETGYVRQECAFTEDLDAVYAKLNALSTNGGEEYVARVVRHAAASLDWTGGSKALKLVYVAGNEPATQDPQVKVEDAFKEAIAKGIQVNTIFCGSPSDPACASWRDAATLADGQFACIDQQAGLVQIATPMDDRLGELGRKLNGTYVGYGAGGGKGLQAQEAMDSAAGAMAPSAEASRAVAKAGRLYRQSGWDLIDACEEGKADLGSLKDAELPAEMQKLDEKGRKEYVARKAAERKGIQEEILKLNKDREDFLRDARAKQGNGNSLDAALVKSLRTQAEKKGFKFE